MKALFQHLSIVILVQNRIVLFVKITNKKHIDQATCLEARGIQLVTDCTLLSFHLTFGKKANLHVSRNVELFL